MVLGRILESNSCFERMIASSIVFAVSSVLSFSSVASGMSVRSLPRAVVPRLGLHRDRVHRDERRHGPRTAKPNGIRGIRKTLHASLDGTRLRHQSCDEMAWRPDLWQTRRPELRVAT